MTTPNQIILPTSPETRAKLQAAQFDPVVLDPDLEQWFAGGYCFTLRDGQVPSVSRLRYTDDDLPLDLALLFAAILGIQTTPPGMVLVPLADVKILYAAAKVGLHELSKVKESPEVGRLLQGMGERIEGDWRLALDRLQCKVDALCADTTQGAPSKGDITP